MPTLPSLNAISRQRRSLVLERSSVDEDARTVTVAFSSEAPVERWWGTEVLSHEQSAVDLSFLRSGTAPLLLDHSPASQVGVVVDARIGVDRKGRAVVRFGRSARADEVFHDVLDGIRSNISVGYELLELIEQPAGDAAAPSQVFVATRWKPLEISVVAIPADVSVGVGRGDPASSSGGQPNLEHRISMTTNHNPPAPSGGVEIQRVRGIHYLASRHGLEDMGNRAIQEGTSLEQFREDVLTALDRRGAGRPLNTAPISPTEDERIASRGFSIQRAIMTHLDRGRLDGAEAEASAEIAKRLGRPSGSGFYAPLSALMPPRGQRAVHVVGTANIGGALVGTDFMAEEFIDVLRAATVVGQLGARSLSGLTGNVSIPKQSGATTASWVAENGAATESNVTLGQLTMTPRQVTGNVTYSLRLLRQGLPDIDTMLRSDLTAQIALAIDAAAISGTGASNQPTGILSTAGIGSVTGTSLGYAGVLEFATDLASSNSLRNSLGFVTTPAVASLLSQRQRFASTDTPLWEGPIVDGRLAGFPARSSTQVPAATLIFGDWSQLVIGNWGAVEIFADTAPTTGITTIGAHAFVDVGIRQAAAFSVANSIT